MPGDGPPHPPPPDLRGCLPVWIPADRHASADARAPQERPRRRVAAEDCLVFLKDRFPAYISWERFESNQGEVAANRSRSESPGAVRDGAALLAGVVWCGRCGKRMYVQVRTAWPPALVHVQHLAVRLRPAAVPGDHGGRGRGVGGRARPGGVAAGRPGSEPRRGRRGPGATPTGGPALGAADRAVAVRGGSGRPAVPRVRAGEPPGGPDPGAAVGRGTAGGPAIGGGVRSVHPDPTATPGRSRAGAGPPAGRRGAGVCGRP